MAGDVRRVKIGDTVRVRLGSRAPVCFTIVLSDKTDPDRGIISSESPLGKALIGKAEGNRAEYTVNSSVFRAEIMEIMSEQKN